MFKTVDGLDYDRIDDVCKKLTAAAEKAPDLQKIILPLDERLIRAASNCHKAFIRRANGLFLYQISLFPVGLQVDAETRELLLKSLGERTLISRTIFDDEEHSPRAGRFPDLPIIPICVYPGFRSVSCTAVFHTATPLFLLSTVTKSDLPNPKAVTSLLHRFWSPAHSNASSNGRWTTRRTMPPCAVWKL